jgi:hypothetical protein
MGWTFMGQLSHARRKDILTRDEHRCVYCGLVFDPVELTVDHVQPRIRRGDRSGGNLVTACQHCNMRKGHQKLAAFLAGDATARHNFFRYASGVIWPRHLRTLRDDLEAMGIVCADVDVLAP